MKKFLMMAFVAVMAFAAQAVNLKWTGSESITETSITGIKGNAYSVVAAITIAPNTKGQNLNDKILSVIGNGKTVNLYNYAQSGGIGADAGGAWSAAHDNKYSNGTFLVTMIFDSTKHMTLYIGNDKIYNPDIGSTYNKDLKITYDADVVKKGSLAVYDGALTTEEIAKLTTQLGKGKLDFASVPEPTVLALLALGVAGLALKRKVA